MEWGGAARLSRARSCACPSAMPDIGSWCNGSRGRRRNLDLSRGYAAEADAYYDDYDDDGELAPLDYAGGRASTPRWRALWRRIVRGKRRIFGGAPAVRVPYDAFTYAQNFEERGSTELMEPENLSRSFSSRFANPSGMFSRFA